MNADLVGPSGDDPDLYQGKLFVLCKNGAIASCFSSPFGPDSHLGPVNGVAADGSIDPAFFRIADGDGQVAFVNVSGGKEGDEFVVGFSCFGSEENACGLLV